jgi:hypothetical protein
MKKILFILTLLLTLSLSTTLASTGDIDGFKGYKWGTDFQTIDKDKQLVWLSAGDEVGHHVGIRDSVIDKNGEPKIDFAYIFYDNKLVSGMIFFYDPQNNTDFSDAIDSLKHRYGTYDEYHAPFYFYNFPTTTLFYSTTGASSKIDSRAIMFYSRKYVEEAIEREKRAEAQKKQNNYNRIFN